MPNPESGQNPDLSKEGMSLDLTPREKEILTKELDRSINPKQGGLGLQYAIELFDLYEKVAGQKHPKDDGELRKQADTARLSDDS